MGPSGLQLRSTNKKPGLCQDLRSHFPSKYYLLWVTSTHTRLVGFTFQNVWTVEHHHVIRSLWVRFSSANGDFWEVLVTWPTSFFVTAFTNWQVIFSLCKMSRAFGTPSTVTRNGPDLSCVALNEWFNKWWTSRWVALSVPLSHGLLYPSSIFTPQCRKGPQMTFFSLS